MNAQSQPRVIFLIVHGLLKVLPGITSTLELLTLGQHHLIDGFGKLHTKTFGDVPCDVAVHEPDTELVQVCTES